MAAAKFELLRIFYSVLLLAVLFVPEHSCSELGARRLQVDRLSVENPIVFGVIFGCKIRRWRHASKFKISFAITQETKHGSFCLSLPHQPFEVDITVFVDVERNPGPSIAPGFNCAENVGNLDSSTLNVWPKINYSGLDLRSLKNVSRSYIEPCVFNYLKDLGILRLRRFRGEKRMFKANSRGITVIIRRDQSSTFNDRHVNFANLREICISPVATSTITDQTKLCLLNA